MLSSAGGLAGAALATLLARALSAWRAPIDVPVQLDVTVDGRVLLFAFALSLVAGVLFGVAPARFASATDPNVALKGTEPERRLSRRWAFRDLLVAAQVAICFVLVSACFISVRGLQRALVMPLGFEPRGVALASFELGLAGYDQPHGQLFQRRALEEATHLPGVKSAAYSNSLPLSIDQSHNSTYPAEPQGHPTERADAHQAREVIEEGDAEEGSEHLGDHAPAVAEKHQQIPLDDRANAGGVPLDRPSHATSFPSSST